MSRCFPYPPPGYYRNGTAHDALIESIKLQKDTNKTKTERKKEKKAKKEKRQKEKSNTFTEFPIKETNASTELLEKSDLTQEHGQPVSQHQPSYSSDSTQNSNKRKRDDYSVVPDNSAGHGSFKIRFLKKQKGSDSSSLVADVTSNTNSSVSSFNSARTLVSCNRKNGIPTTSLRENRTQTQTQTKSNPISQGTTIGDLNRVHFGRIQSASSLAKPVFQCVKPQPPVLHRTHLEHEVPSSSASRNIDEEMFCSVRQPQEAPCYRGISNLVSNKTSMTAVGKQSVNEVTVPINTKQEEDLQKVGPSRSERKMLKKQAKYEKLIGSWLPPVSPGNLPDDDWLSSSKPSSSSILKGEVETCRESVASWQPCARFLAEADIHALPYTVPF